MGMSKIGNTEDLPGAWWGEQTQEQLQVLLQHPAQEESSIWIQTTGCQHGTGKGSSPALQVQPCELYLHGKTEESRQKTRIFFPTRGGFLLVLVGFEPPLLTCRGGTGPVVSAGRSQAAP